ncbi:hypothetical protein ACU5DF_02850 [Aliivibrio wodanis]|uniref:hypothetical protein n=1 Tax=Aliivibrio wodanis TaxID=80852 RepID=UPI00406CC3A9
MDVFPNRLSEFMSEPRHTKGRESLLMKRLTFDLQLAAAIDGSYLMAYEVDVDHNGYDLILDTEMVSKKLQVKSKNSEATTKSWFVSKGLLRPTEHEINDVSFWGGMDGTGISGGVILKIFTVRDTVLDIEYFYTDLRILTLKNSGVIGNKTTQASAAKVLMKIIEGHYHDKVELRLQHFVKVKEPEFLLPLMGLGSRYSTSNWIHYFRSRKFQENQKEFIAPRKYLDDSIKEDLAVFCDISY